MTDDDRDSLPGEETPVLTPRARQRRLSSEIERSFAEHEARRRSATPPALEGPTLEELVAEAVEKAIAARDVEWEIRLNEVRAQRNALRRELETLRMEMIR